MDFSVIRPRPPPKRPEPPAPKPPAVPEDKPLPPQHEKPLPPQHPRPPLAMPHMGPYMEEIDRISRMEHLRNIEYTNARTWRMNFGHHPNDHYDNSYNNNYGCHNNYHPGGGYNEDYTHHMFPVRPHPSSDHHHYSLTGPPQRLALPPPDHSYGTPGPSCYPGPYYGGGYFSDENPNGCMIM